MEFTAVLTRLCVDHVRNTECSESACGQTASLTYVSDLFLIDLHMTTKKPKAPVGLAVQCDRSKPQP